jgi:hypothetical protein
MEVKRSAVPPMLLAQADVAQLIRPDVRLLPKADIGDCTAHVRFRG